METDTRSDIYSTGLDLKSEADTRLSLIHVGLVETDTKNSLTTDETPQSGTGRTTRPHTGASLTDETMTRTQEK